MFPSETDWLYKGVKNGILNLNFPEQDQGISEVGISYLP
jgi:hypothetical protein